LKYSITSLCLLLYCRWTAYNHAAFSILKHILLHHLSLFFQFLRQFLNFIHSADSACCYSTKLGFIEKKPSHLQYEQWSPGNLCYSRACDGTWTAICP
jgi:hypothetical protein